MSRWYRHRYHTPFSHLLVFGIIPHVPRALHPPIAVVTSLIFMALLRRERRAVRANVAAIRGARGVGAWWTTFQVFYSFCDFMVGYCYIPQADDDGLLAMLTSGDGGQEPIERCLAGGHGLIAWTAHLGNWELASRLLELHGRPVHVARAVEAGNEAETMLRALMDNGRLRVVDVSDPLAAVQLLNALRANEIVAVQGDRALSERAIELPFFGRPARFPTGPFVLSYFSGAPVLPCLAVRTGWLRYRMVPAEPIVPDCSLDVDRAVREGLERAVGFLEAQLRHHHAQWLNFYDFWENHPVSSGGRR